jgi:hypothetical protein
MDGDGFAFHCFPDEIPTNLFITPRNGQEAYAVRRLRSAQDESSPDPH